MSKDFLLFGVERNASLPAQFQLIITDNLESPGNFILIYYLNKALKQSNSISFISNSIENYHKILKKTGVQLNIEINKGIFEHISTTAAIQSIHQDQLNLIIQNVQSSDSTLLLLDDLSDLLWSGYSPKTLTRFIATLRQIMFQRGGSIIILLHGDELRGTGNLSDEFLFRSILQNSDLWLQTTPISSQSRGELSIHRGPALIQSHGIVTKSGIHTLQYKLEEAGAVFSEKGLERGFI